MTTLRERMIEDLQLRGVLEHFIRWSETAYGKPFDPGKVMARDVRDWKAYQ
jgi:hypothetical protein